MDSPKPDEDIVLGLLDDDPEALRDLVLKHAGAVESAICRRFPKLTPSDAEDVMAEALARLWASRSNYDEGQSLRAYYWGIARHVAMEFAARRRRWQKSQGKEILVDPTKLSERVDERTEQRLNKLEENQNGIAKAAKDAVESLKPLQQEIVYAYAFAGDYEIGSANLGRELGEKYDDGSPIPDSTIRVYKMRAMESVRNTLKKQGFDLNRREERR